MPVTITGSISSNLENIEEKQLKIQISFRNNLYWSILIPILGSLLILAFTLEE